MCSKKQRVLCHPFPVNILNWHEIVNHRVGGEEVAVAQRPQIDPRHHPKEMVLGLVGAASAKAYPYVSFGGDAVVNDRFEGPAIVVVFQESAQLALAFRSFAGGRELTFELAQKTSNGKPAPSLAR